MKSSSEMTGTEKHLYKTVTEKIQNKCRRCNGTGHLIHYNHHRNGVCFTCSGQGYKTEYQTVRVIVGNTPEYEAVVKRELEEERERLRRANEEWAKANPDKEWWEALYDENHPEAGMIPLIAFSDDIF